MQTLSYVTTVLSLLAGGPYITLFNLKPLIEDGNLKVGMHCTHAKAASEAPRTHFRACKISIFPGDMPPDPLAQSLLWPPLFVFALDLPNSLSSPAGVCSHCWRLPEFMESSSPSDHFLSMNSLWNLLW